MRMILEVITLYFYTFYLHHVSVFMYHITALYCIVCIVCMGNAACRDHLMDHAGPAAAPGATARPAAAEF
jgi:hypothetical protein